MPAAPAPSLPPPPGRCPVRPVQVVRKYFSCPARSTRVTTLEERAISAVVTPDLRGGGGGRVGSGGLGASSVRSIQGK